MARIKYYDETTQTWKYADNAATFDYSGEQMVALCEILSDFVQIDGTSISCNDEILTA